MNEAARPPAVSRLQQALLPRAGIERFIRVRDIQAAGHGGTSIG